MELYSIYVEAYLGGEFGGDCMAEFFCCSAETLISQHCWPAIPQYKIKSLKKKKGICDTA